MIDQGEKLIFSFEVCGPSLRVTVIQRKARRQDAIKAYYPPASSQAAGLLLDSLGIKRQGRLGGRSISGCAADEVPTLPAFTRRIIVSDSDKAV